MLEPVWRIPYEDAAQVFEDEERERWLEPSRDEPEDDDAHDESHEDDELDDEPQDD